MMIKAKNIYKSYGSLDVLKGVNIEIPDAEIVSIVGNLVQVNLLLLQILGTLDSPSNTSVNDTEILLNGKIFSEMSDKELSRFHGNRNIGFVFQFHQLLP